uniref:Virion infectivity factor n=1 Tax=Simian immunodeficiency virus TaxID=11723 RepID=A0A1Z3GU28_SIV|nr:vif protein [Simian immunodeficiency virus]ASC61380.1 vif protein [Simian immunodeficiency virus]ASC61387.1 vif protein [Simian immunodeficiency virus]ASC61494.1 vif protein [Simian immunodeficiency virus]
MRINIWKSLVKHHIWETKVLKPWKYRHHYENDHPKKGEEVHIPLPTLDTKLVVTVFWGLQCGERPWHLGHGVSIEWRCGKYITQVDPETADQMIHQYYFPCFSDQAVRQAILGERILTYCHYKKGHSQVGTLQYLAFCKVLESRGYPRGPRRQFPSLSILTEDRWNKPRRMRGHRENQ